jgi:hypothetical protein
MEGSKEQLLGKFWHKCWQAGLHIKQTEPYTPWLNAAEGAICELNWGVGCKMVWSCTPKWLWDECLEWEALVQFVTAHDIYSLDGQVPQTIVKGETTNISAIALFHWYEWIMFRVHLSLSQRTTCFGLWLGTGHQHRTGNDPEDPQEEWTCSLLLHGLIFDRRQIQKWGHDGKM